MLPIWLMAFHLRGLVKSTSGFVAIIHQYMFPLYPGVSDGSKASPA